MFAREAVEALYVIVALLAVVVATIAWRRRHRAPAAGIVAVTALASGLWSFGALIAFMATSFALWRWAVIIVIIAICTAVGGFVVQSLTIARPGWRPSKTLLIGLSIEPVVIFISTFQHPLQPGGYRIAGPAELSGRFIPLVDPWFLAHTGYSYLLMSFSIITLIRAWWSARGVFRAQMRTIWWAGTMPFVINIVALILGHGSPSIDVTPLGLLVTTALTSYALSHQGLLTIVPVARTLVLEHVTEAVLVTDPNGVLVDANPAGQLLLTGDREHSPDYIGHPLSSLLDWSLDLPDNTVGIRTLTIGGHRQSFDVRLSDLLDADRRLIGRVLVARDVTSTHEQQEHLRRANDELREQIAIVEALRHDLAEKAARDSLTGLYNRRQLLLNLDRDVAQAKASSHLLCVTMIDIDQSMRHEIYCTYGDFGWSGRCGAVYAPQS